MIANGIALSLTHSLTSGVPSWLSDISSFAIAGWDFRTDQRFRLNYEFARSTESYMLGSGSDVEQFSANELCRIDDIGAQLETAKTRLSLYPRQVGGGDWSNNGGASTTALSTEGVFTTPARVASGGSTSDRRQSSDIALTGGVPYRVNLRYRKGTSANSRLYNRTATGSVQSMLAGVVGSLSLNQSDAGIFSNIVNTPLVGDLYEVSATFEPTATYSDYRIAPGPGTATSGQNIDILACQLVSGEGRSSWIFGSPTAQFTRAADELTLKPYGVGSYDVHALLSDDSVQVIAEGVQGDYDLEASLLTLPIVKAIYLTRPGAPVPMPDPGYYSMLNDDGKAPSTTTWLTYPAAVHTGAVAFTGMDRSLKFSSMGNKARFELQDTTNDRRAADPEYKRRSELSFASRWGNDAIVHGNEYWGAFQFDLTEPTDLVGMAGEELIISQMHGGEGFGSPALAIRYLDGNLKVTTRNSSEAGQGTTRYDSAITTDAVHDIVLRCVFGSTVGELDMWLDGSQILNLTGIGMGAADTGEGPYWKMGLYAPGGMAGTLVAEFANFTYWQSGSLSSRVSSPPTWPTD